ncbi:S8 family serine peptidase [Brevibacillus brevis]|uniref:S8 family serine peptidase n=1 Tax=Brevibacillus brevis TaxID=1393 RepID=A0ABY9T2J4_BREBE|nr:S8 family serine peptidase [Brevibacillus brevis]WNC14104.1 S8 family serine peptidase [Brevibacillus brevis]
MRKIHLITFKERDHLKNKAKLEKHIAKHAVKRNLKKPKLNSELKRLPRVFIIEDADDELLEDLENDGDIVAVEENIYDKPLMAQSPSEWSHTLSDILGFHSRGYTGAGVKVGFIDTGAANHEDLVYAGRYNAYTAVHGGTTPAEASKNPHGTMVAGIIGARNNEKGYVGVAPECLLYAVKADDNSSTTTDISVDAQIKGIEWLVDQGVKIINCSFGNTFDSLARKTAMRDAYENDGVLFICGAGNDGRSTGNNQVSYPAAYDFVIAVGCVKKNRVSADYTSRGPEIDVCAPGDGVMTTVPSSANQSGTDYTTPSTVYGSFNGTSCATPHVAGLAALYKQMYPKYTVDQLRNLIETNVEELGKDGHDVVYGKGMVKSPWFTPTNYIGKTTSTSATLNGSSYSGSITNGAIQHVKFIPASSGLYDITTSSSLDLYLQVFDTNYNLMGQDDDGAGSSQPKLSLNLTAGQTYYIAISGFSNTQTGSFTLNTVYQGNYIVEDFEDSSFTIPFNSGWKIAPLVAYKGNYGYTNVGTSQATFKVTVPTGVTNAKLSFWYLQVMNPGDSFKVVINGVEKYSATANADWVYKEFMLGEGTNNVAFSYTGTGHIYVDEVTVSGKGVTVGAWTGGGGIPGESLTNPVILSGSSSQGNLMAGSADYFKYVPTTSGTFTFDTDSSIDLVMDLLNSSGEVITNNDDSDGNSQPRISYFLSAGTTYFLRVYGYNSSITGTFILNVTNSGGGVTPVSITEDFTDTNFNFTIVEVGGWTVGSGKYSAELNTTGSKEFYFTVNVPASATTRTVTVNWKLANVMGTPTGAKFEILVNDVVKHTTNGTTSSYTNTVIALGTGSQTIKIRASLSSGHVLPAVETITVNWS